MPTYHYTAHLSSLQSSVAFVLPGVPCHFLLRVEPVPSSGSMFSKHSRICLDYDQGGRTAMHVDEVRIMFACSSTSLIRSPKTLVDTSFPPFVSGSFFSDKFVQQRGAEYDVEIRVREPDDGRSTAARHLARAELLEARLLRKELAAQRHLDERERLHARAQSAWQLDRQGLEAQKSALANAARTSRAAHVKQHEALKKALQASAAALSAVEAQRNSIAVTLALITTSPQPYDVCLDFPRIGRQLWTTSTVLSASPYFKDLLSSSFQEGGASPADGLSTTASDTELEPYTFDDSDAEVDAEYGALVAPALVSPSAPFHRVVVKDSAYSTYRAVLVWLQTGHIEFARLRSAARSASGGEVELMGSSASECPRRVSAPSSSRPSSPSRSSSTSSSSTRLAMPLTSSPKSVYRLADLLSLPSLASLALSSFAAQLSPANTATELYTDAAACYPALRDAALEVAVARWEEVAGAQATRDVEQRAEAGELPAGSAKTAMLLARRLAQAGTGAQAAEKEG